MGCGSSKPAVTDEPIALKTFHAWKRYVKMRKFEKEEQRKLNEAIAKKMEAQAARRSEQAPVDAPVGAPGAARRSSIKPKAQAISQAEADAIKMHVAKKEAASKATAEAAAEARRKRLSLAKEMSEEQSADLRAWQAAEIARRGSTNAAALAPGMASALVQHITKLHEEGSPEASAPASEPAAAAPSTTAAPARRRSSRTIRRRSSDIMDRGLSIEQVLTRTSKTVAPVGRFVARSVSRAGGTRRNSTAKTYMI